MTTGKLDRVKLRAAAEKALVRECWQGTMNARSLFYKAADPTTVLALIADLEAAEAKLERHVDLFVRVGQRYRKLREALAAATKLIEKLVGALSELRELSCEECGFTLEDEGNCDGCEAYSGAVMDALADATGDGDE